MKKSRKIIIILGLVIIFIVITLILLYISYLKPISKSDKIKEIKIETGLTSRDIGILLEENNLIKDDKFFLLYLKINDINDLKAGTYKLSENMSLKEIIAKLQEGNNFNENEISITFKEGINFREFARVVEANTNNTYDEVLSFVSLDNKDYLNILIEDYWFITEDILNSDIYYPLEGYLFPDTYSFKDKDVTIAEIVKKLLDQMNIILTPYQKNIENSSYTVHEFLTLASIAEKEVNNSLDRGKVISVFLNRIEKNISLGSDITTRYGIKLDDTRALTKSEYASSNPYNTRNINMLGLPAGPIAMVSKSSIEASIKPDKTDYIYFISNIKTDETFFFENSRDFENKKQELASVNGGY